VLAGLAVMATGARAAEPPAAEPEGAKGANAPDPSYVPWDVDVYYENDTRFRGKDETGTRVGLSKFRNTLQVEADKKLGGSLGFHGILRGTYDGVYDMNSSQYGKDAGGPIQLENTAAPAFQSLGAPFLNTPTVAFGSGLNNAIGQALGLPASNAFGFNSTDPNAPNYNPNAGLRVLGDRWHTTQGGVAFGVPVRPCNVDGRGCRDFGGYGNAGQNGLQSPEFNERLDFIREAYFKDTVELGDDKTAFFKVGKQQVVWGRTDLFRVLDVINPVDFSRNNIYDELQDIRIPQWIAQGEYRMGGSDFMQERNVQVVWNFDQFRANNLGQCGTPNVILDAGCFFRGMANLWDNGGTVANFASVPPGQPGMYAATDFGPHQIGIRDVKLPGYLGGMALGVKYEGVTKDGLSFSLNALSARSQFPSLHAFNAGATNPFTGAVNAGAPGYLIAFDMVYPRVNLIGGSLDFQIQPLSAAVRMEAAVTSGEEFANTKRAALYSENKVFRYVVGVDRPTFIPFINPNRTTLISAQLFYQHIFNHESEQGAYGTVGMPDWEDNVLGTLLIRASYLGDRLNPQVIMARDFAARAWVASPQVEWLQTDDLKFTIGANVKGRSDENRWKFDDCRSCNPYPPFTQYAAQGSAPGSAGLGGLEPLGRFRAGPIGAAWKENEVFFTMRYKF
jgi:hypothetical protein